MYCEKCGTEVQTGKRFCSKCGNPMPKTEYGRVSSRIATQGGKSQVIAAATTGFCGLVVFISTYLNWLSGWSGWASLVNSRGRGRFFYFGRGVGIFFTGFWSFVLGLLIIAGAVLLILNRRSGGVLAIAAGGLGMLLGLANLIAQFSTRGVPSVGVWLFLIFSIGALASGILSLIYLLKQERSPAPQAL